jgi:hypothetical protein
VATSVGGGGSMSQRDGQSRPEEQSSERHPLVRVVDPGRLSRLDARHGRRGVRSAGYTGQRR